MLFKVGVCSHFDNSVEFFYNHATNSTSQLYRKGFFMKEYTTEFLRNIALVSHGGAGKTMLAEAFLHATGATTRLGKVEDGTAASDYDEEENRRKISIYSSVLPIEHRDHKINVIDAPGYTDFVGEMISAPVSYTHLRAHETPEHLVCRLLLEK